MNAADIIKKLNLQALEPEGGWFAQTFQSPRKLNIDGGGERALASAIYYLITPDNFSRLHRLKHVEIYHFYAGARAELTLISPEGVWASIQLGRDIAAGEVPQYVVPAGTWQAVTIVDGEKVPWTLLGTTMSPGFDFKDFELAERDQLLSRFPSQHSHILKLT